MKLSKQTLLEALEAVLPVIHPNPVLPITAMVLFTEKWVCGTNLESSLAVVNTTGITGIAVPAEAAKFLKLCGEEVDVDIVTEGKSITMKVASGKLKATFECESLEHAPRMPGFQEGTEYLPDLKTLAQFVENDELRLTRFILVKDGKAYASDRSNLACHAHGGAGNFQLSTGQAKLIQSSGMIKYMQDGNAVYMSNGSVYMQTTFDGSAEKLSFDTVIDMRLGMSTGTVNAGNIGSVKNIAGLSMMFPHMIEIEYNDSSCTAWSYDRKYSMGIEWGLVGIEANAAYNAGLLKIAASVCNNVHTGTVENVHGQQLPSLLFTNDKYTFILGPSTVER